MTKIGQFLREILMPLCVIAVMVIFAYDHFYPRQAVGPAAVDGKALARSYAASLAPDLAVGWAAAADALDRGKTVAESQAALQAAWQAARIASFSGKVGPAFAAVLPEGAEPTDPARRAEVVKLWRDFAAGLKGGK